MNWRIFDIRYIGIASLVFLAALICLLGYLIDQIFHVFGPVLLIGGSLTIVIGEIIFFYLPTEMKENDNGNIEFNTNELLRISGIIVTGIVISFMFLHVTQQEKIISNEAQFGAMVYITLISLFPVLLKIFRLLRDIQDYIKLDITEGTLSYRDNNTKERFLLDELKKAIVDEKGGITIEFLSGEKHHIPTYQMNFGRIGTRRAMIKIQKEINKRRFGS